MSNYPSMYPSIWPKDVQERYERVMKNGEIEMREEKRKDFEKCWGEMVTLFISLYSQYGKNWRRSENFGTYLERQEKLEKYREEMQERERK